MLSNIKRAVILSEAKDLCISSSANKCIGFFATLRMTNLYEMTVRMKMTG